MLHFNPASRRNPAGAGSSLTTATAPFVDGLLREFAAIGSRSRKREKQESRLHAPGVVLQSRHLRLSPNRGRQFLPEPRRPGGSVRRSCASASGQIARAPSVPDGRIAPGSGACARATPLPVNSTGMPMRGRLLQSRFARSCLENSARAARPNPAAELPLRAQKNPLVQSTICGSHRSVVGSNGISRLDQRGRDGRTKIGDRDIVFVGLIATLRRNHLGQIFRHVHDAQPGGGHFAKHRCGGRAAVARPCLRFR